MERIGGLVEIHGLDFDMDIEGVIPPVDGYIEEM